MRSAYGPDGPSPFPVRPSTTHQRHMIPARKTVMFSRFRGVGGFPLIALALAIWGLSGGSAMAQGGGVGGGPHVYGGIPDVYAPGYGTFGLGYPAVLSETSCTRPANDPAWARPALASRGSRSASFVEAGRPPAFTPAACDVPRSAHRTARPPRDASPRPPSTPAPSRGDRERGRHPGARPLVSSAGPRRPAATAPQPC